MKDKGYIISTEDKVRIIERWWFWLFIVLTIGISCFTFIAVIANSHPFEIRLMTNDEMAELADSVATMKKHELFNDCLTGCESLIEASKEMNDGELLSQSFEPYYECGNACNSYYSNGETLE